jgi:hypothetical protein
MKKTRGQKSRATVPLSPLLRQIPVPEHQELWSLQTAFGDGKCSYDIYPGFARNSFK